jgi:hypothetical protein
MAWLVEGEEGLDEVTDDQAGLYGIRVRETRNSNVEVVDFP